jgi:hypothetical protein
MAKQFKVAVAHSLGTAGAIERINSGIAQAQATVGTVAEVEQTHWDGDILSWTLRVAGVRLSGTTTVGNDSANVETELPTALAPFAQRAETMVQKYGVALLTADPQQEARRTEMEKATKPTDEERKKARQQKIRQQAVAAAKAAGHDWSKMSPEERKPFKVNARQSLRDARAAKKDKDSD